MAKTFFFFMVALACYGTSQKQLNIAGTKWICPLSKDCVYFMIFKSDSSYVDYNCEVDEHYFGVYHVKSDTIVLFQQRGEYDDEFPEDSKHWAERKTIFLLFKHNKIIYGDELKYTKDRDYKETQKEKN